ncbi:MAG: DUF2270 domain-containing protein [Candidatus Eisenbacteria bacterium]|nr:DUF2270 domain-containing protein [Candidatus Eisenbacteria bacterium]
MDAPTPKEGCYEDRPLGRSEYITAMVHLYRGELQRANSWRLRLDHTTNWAIIAVIGLLSFTFGTPDHPHILLVFGMYMVFTFLSLEARRFRFFDVWRSRVRLIEENFYAPILRRELDSPYESWGKLVAEDLLRPSFKMSFAQALRARLVRNYSPLFLVLLACWFLKVLIHPIPVAKTGDFLRNIALGPIPWFVSILLLCPLYGTIVYLIFFVKKGRVSEMDWWTHLSEAEGVDRLDR